MNNEIWEKQVWKVFDAFYKENNITSIQIESFNQFVTFGMQEIVDQESTISIGKKYTAKFGQISLAPPQVIEEDRSLEYTFPADARLRELDYTSAIHCDITEIYSDGDQEEVKEHRRVLLGRMPIMLNSVVCNLSKMNEEQKIAHGECPNDQGGYFIIKGNERVLVGQMRANYNQVFVLKKKSGKHSYIAEVRSMSSETGHSVLVQALITEDKRKITFSLPCIKEKIPVGIVFKALGFITNEEILNLIGITPCSLTQQHLNHIIRDSYFCTTQKDALKYIGQFAMHSIPTEKEEAYAWQVVESELFPHLGISGTIKEQACFLGNIVRKLLMTVTGMRGEDDRDNLAAKRVEVAGALMYEIFRNLFKKYVLFIKGQLEKRKQRPDILSIITRIKSITKGLHQCLATGNWGVQKNASYIRTGVSQVLDRMTYGSTISHLRRILIPVGKQGKSSAIRQIHSSQFGFICPCETPEGQKVGVVLNFALFAKVSSKIPTVNVRRVLEDCKTITSIKDLDFDKIKDYTPVFLNGIIIGYSKNPEDSIQEIKTFRTKRLLDDTISIAYDIIDNDIRIYSDEGRFIRPLLTINNNMLGAELNIPIQEEYSWRDLIKKGYVKYLDASEIETSVIAMYPKDIKNKDYCEIHPCTILGVMGAMIPFPDHSQSPRNCYQSSMGKQALGVPVLSYNLRTDTVLNVLHYSQKPIISTKPSQYLGYSKMPSGVNAIVAIACYTGYNQEDSIILNQASIQRGIFRLVTYRSYDKCEKKRDSYSYEQICVPPENTTNIKPDEPGYFKRKHANYSLLDSTGVIMSRFPYERRCTTEKCKFGWYNANENEFCPDCKRKGIHERGGESIYVRKGDVIIGKVIISSTKGGDSTKIDASQVIQDGEEGYIDRVHVNITPNGYKLVKVVIRKIREPVLGDKLASRAAQKGTIGAILPEKDMPFSITSGICPDIIINALCIPSRMTINQLIECAMGKVCTLKGKYGDATPFTQSSENIADKYISEASEYMKSLGMNEYGWEELACGITGEVMNAKIFMGPTFYQRLKHMVDDKMHARAEGDVTLLTRQPQEGRARDGGLRFGEMERDCMIVHGASRFMRERLFDVSDGFYVVVCRKCGIMTYSLNECQKCKGDKLVKVCLPYASKLLIQELSAMGIKILIRSE